MFLNWVQGPYNGKIDVQTVDIGENNKFSKVLLVSLLCKYVMIYYLNVASLNYYKKYEIAYKILAAETYETLWMYTCDVHHIFSTFKTHYM